MKRCARNTVSLLKKPAVFFFDIYEITYADSRFDEMRYVTIGMSDLARLLVIAWTQRNENIRLITAMKAEKSHEQRYRR